MCKKVTARRIISYRATVSTSLFAVASDRKTIQGRRKAELLRCEIRALRRSELTKGGMVHQSVARFTGNSAFIAPTSSSGHTTFSANQVSHLAVLRSQALNQDEEIGRHHHVLAQLCRLPPSICLASILARKPNVHMHPGVSSRHRQADVGFQLPAHLRFPHGCPSLFHDNFLWEE